MANGWPSTVCAGHNFNVVMLLPAAPAVPVMVGWICWTLPNTPTPDSANSDNRVPESSRQICWAHLKRDFKKVVDRGGKGEGVGNAGLRVVRRVFEAWHAHQKKEITREGLQERLAPVIRRLNAVLVAGCKGDDPTAATFCNNLLELEQAMWTFARVAGVEPTNNHIERLLRRAVLWRKRSFGSQSEAGCRFVERILTVVQTRRLRGEGVLEFLHDALVAARAGLSCPKLVPNG